jgi:hypothetical protein
LARANHLQIQQVEASAGSEMGKAGKKPLWGSALTLPLQPAGGKDGEDRRGGSALTLFFFVRARLILGKPIPTGNQAPSLEIR